MKNVSKVISKSMLQNDCIIMFLKRNKDYIKTCGVKSN